MARLCHALDSLLVDKQGSEHFEDVSSEESPGVSLSEGERAVPAHAADTQRFWQAFQ